jgi:hypothetical protein
MFVAADMSDGASKNLSFHAELKNVHMTLGKSAPKKVLPKKPILVGLKPHSTSSKKNVFIS